MRRRGRSNTHRTDTHSQTIQGRTACVYVCMCVCTHPSEVVRRRVEVGGRACGGPRVGPGGGRAPAGKTKRRKEGGVAGDSSSPRLHCRGLGYSPSPCPGSEGVRAGAWPARTEVCRSAARRPGVPPARGYGQVPEAAPRGAARRGCDRPVGAQGAGPLSAVLVSSATWLVQGMTRSRQSPPPGPCQLTGPPPGGRQAP